MADTLLLVDAYSMIYRAFFAIRHLTGPNAEPVNAIFGVTKMLRKLIAERRPTHVAVVFDLGAPRKRLAVLPSYKEHRPPTPPDLEAQLPAIRSILESLRLPVVEVDGEEADDIIGTLAVRAAAAGFTVWISTNDKDFTQLINDRIRLLRPGEKADVVFDSAAVHAKYGLRPEQMVDFFTLTGDSIDNVPGIPGIGEKTATGLLQQFGTLDDLLGRTAEITRPKLRATLAEAGPHARQNRELVKLVTDLPLPVDLPALAARAPDYPALIAKLRSHGFKSLTAEVEREANTPADLFG